MPLPFFPSPGSPGFLAFAGGSVGVILIGFLILASTVAYIIWLIKRKL